MKRRPRSTTLVPTISPLVLARIEGKYQATRHWSSELSETDREQLRRKENLRRFCERVCIDGFWRVSYTTSLIESAAASLERKGELGAARWWRRHLAEEEGHDRQSRADLDVLFGGKRGTARMLRRHRLSPPTASLVSYFQFQLREGDPHQLIALRLFLEHSMARPEPDLVERVLGPEATRTYALHRELDGGHSHTCLEYLDRWIAEPRLPDLFWSIDFTARAITDTQRYLAWEVLHGPKAPRRRTK